MQCCAASLLQCCAASLLRCCAASLLRCCAASLLRCCTASLLRCCTVSLLRCCTVSLLRCCTVSLLRCCVASLLQCCAASMLRCCTASLLHCFDASMLRRFIASLLRCFRNQFSKNDSEPGTNKRMKPAKRYQRVPRSTSIALIGPYHEPKKSLPLQREDYQFGIQVLGWKVVARGNSFSSRGDGFYLRRANSKVCYCATKRSLCHTNERPKYKVG